MPVASWGAGALVIVLFLGAVQLLCLSIIGVYLGKVFEEVKGRPSYVVQRIQNNHRAWWSHQAEPHADAEAAPPAIAHAPARAGVPTRARP